MLGETCLVMVSIKFFFFPVGEDVALLLSTVIDLLKQVKASDDFPPLKSS